MQEGSQFGPYELIKRVAFGGMAEIHLAKTTGIGGFEKLLALKVIHPKYSEDQEFIDMLIDEAKVAVQLSHMNIAQTFDLGQIEGTYYIAMEFIDGKDLYQLLVRASELNIDIPFDILTFIAIETSAALQYAHTKADNYGRPLNLIHRDISPQNVMVAYDGQIKVVDFGIAKASQRSKETESGVIKGKFFYMSPEQAWGDAIDARSDVFSTGICLYEMICGEMLYSEDKALVLLDKVRKAQIPSMRERRPDLPPALEQIVLKALARDRDSRFQSAGALQGALSGFLYTTWPSFSRARVKEFMERVFGTQRFVLPMPAPEKEELSESMLMEAADFDVDAGKSVIFEVGDLEQLLGEGGGLAQFGEEEDRTMVAGGLDELGPPMEDRTIAHAAWDNYDLPEDDDDATAVIDMSAVDAARKAVAEDEETNLYSRDGQAPTGNARVNRPVVPRAGPTAPPAPPQNRLGPQSQTPPARPSTNHGVRQKPKGPFVAAPPIQQGAQRPTLSLMRKPTLLQRILRPVPIILTAVVGLLAYGGFVLVPPMLEEAPEKTVSVRLETIPPGATVLHNGAPLGEKTPTTVHGLKKGSDNEFIFKRKGFEDGSERVVVQASDLAKNNLHMERRVTLKKSKGRLQIVSHPPGAQVFVNGALLGQTPVDERNLERTEREIVMIIKRDGYLVRKEARQWGDETLIKVNVQLVPKAN